MDETMLLQRLSSDTPEPTDAALTAARQRLGDRMELAATSRQRRRAGRPARIARRSAFAGVGIAAATCAAVVVFTTGPAPTASAEVTATLQAAAKAVRTSTVPAGATRTHLLQLVVGSSGKQSADGGLALDSAVLIDSSTTLRKAAEGDGWTRSYGASVPVKSWGPAGRKLVEQSRDDPGSAPSVERSESDPNFWTGTTSLSPEQVRAMPRDPEALLRRFSGVTDPDSALEPDANRVIDAASALLGSGLADPALQAATYRALEHLPDLTVDRNGQDIDGRRGVAISAEVSNGLQRIDLIIDPATGRFLGRTEINLTATDGAPAGTVEEGSAVYPG